MDIDKQEQLVINSEFSVCYLEMSESKNYHNSNIYKYRTFHINN